MPSLRTLLSTHSPLLLLDAASARIQVGLLATGTARWSARDEEAGTGLFGALEELKVDLPAVAAFAFCEGPGSILGIRTAAMAIRAWQVLAARPTYAYQSLALAAAAAPPGSTLVADARRGLWHRYTDAAGLARVPVSDLSGPLLMPAGFRHWAELPPGTASTSYDLPALLAHPAVAGADLFRPAPAPDAFLHEEPTYARWEPKIHRAP